MAAMVTDLRQDTVAMLQKTDDGRNLYSRLRSFEIIMSLATIVSGHFGLPQNTRKLQARAIRAMQFHIKTALGISKEYYKDTKTTPLHGSGQGSGSESTLWLFISSIIMTLYQDLASGMHMSNLDLTDKLQQWIDGPALPVSTKQMEFQHQKPSQNNYKMTQESWNASYQQQGESWN